MTSFGYRLNPRFTIKECLSCGTLYTRDYCCSKGNVEDKILVPKPPKNCTRCRHPVDGPYCQGCTFLRKKLEEDLVTHSQDFQNTFESSDDSTNVVNAPREPFVVKQDHGSFVDKIICDLNKAPDSPHLHAFSPNQFHCFHCKDVLGDGKACQRCTCTRCGSGLSKGLCLIYKTNQNSLNDSPSISANSLQNPPHIDERCYECGDALDGIFCQQCTRKSCGKGAHIGYNCPPKNRPAFYNNGNDDDLDYTIAITPVLSTDEPNNSLSMGDEHLDTIPATKSDEVIKSSVEDLVPILSESEGIPDTMCDVHLVNNPTPLEAKDHFEIVINSNDDYSSSDDDSLYYENIEYVNLLIAEIEALKDNPTPSSEFLTKSSSTSPKSFLEEINTFHNSLPEFENFCFDLEEISSGNTITHSDISLSDYEVFSFYDRHIELISSGSTTTHSDISLSEYDSFIFDLSKDQFPPTDRSDFTHEEFGDELAHIISPPEYDCFYFRNLPDPVEDDHSPLLAYVVWIFLAYLTYPVIPLYLHSFRNEDTIFDLGITINRFYSFKPGLSHRCGTFKKFNTHRSHLNESPMEMLFSTFFPMNQVWGN
nr:hypothetical protein [Tanacetum cinerariifolium]